MRKLATSICIIVISFCFLQTRAGENRNQDPIGLSSNISAIDSQDSVFFDVSQAYTFGGIVSFPVYIESDDTVNAFDFSAKFNQSNFEFDTILNLTSYLQGVSYFNTSDSTIRFTSYSLQPIEMDSTLLLVKFRVLSGQFCSTDLNSISVFLNGDPCSERVMDCVNTGVREIGAQNESKVFPNPATEKVNLFCEKASRAEIFSLQGNVLRELDLSKLHSNEVSIGDFSKGVYIVKFSGANFEEYQKLIVN